MVEKKPAKPRLNSEKQSLPSWFLSNLLNWLAPYRPIKLKAKRKRSEWTKKNLAFSEMTELTGVFVESSSSDLLAALPDVVSGDIVVAGAHVERIVHGLVVLSVPLKNR